MANNSEKEKYGQSFKEMTIKKKREHILEYYKGHILCGIIAVFVLYGALNHYILNPPKKPYSAVVFSGQYVTDEFMDAFAKELNEAVVTDTERFELVTYNFYDYPDDPTYSQSMHEKFYMLIAVKDVDIIIAPTDEFVYLANSSMLLPLDEAFDERELDALSDAVVEANIVLKDKSGEYYLDKAQLFGVSLEGTDYFGRYGTDADGWVLGFVTNSQRIENSKAVFYEIYDWSAEQTALAE